MKILIQAGHGGRKTGATGAPKEQKWTTEIVPKIANKLRDNEFYVKEVGADPSASELSGDWDLFLAVHYDADIYNDRGGFIDTPDPATDFATKESTRIAAEMRKTYFSTTGIPERMNRSNKNTKFYYMWSKVSKKTPCVIIEAGVGFRTPEDHQTLWFEQDKIVEGITKGIIIALKGEPMPDALQKCLKQHDKLVTEAADHRGLIASLDASVESLKTNLDKKDKQVSAQKGLVTQAEKASYACGVELSEAKLRVAELEKAKPVEAIKDPMRYVVSLVIGAIITWAYTQYPFLGQIGPDQQALAVFLIGLVIKGLDKYQYEAGSKVKLPF